MPEPKKATIKPTWGRLAEHARRDQHFNFPADYEPADLLHPMNWANHIREFTVGSVITCLGAGESFDIELRVLEIGNCWIRMKVLRTDVEIIMPDITTDSLNLRIDYNPVDKHRILDHKGNILKKDIPTKLRAMRELELLAAKLRGENPEEAAA